MARQHFCVICAKEFDVTNTTGWVLVCKECSKDPDKQQQIQDFLCLYPFATKEG